MRLDEDRFARFRFELQRHGLFYGFYGIKSYILDCHGHILSLFAVMRFAN
jgi:hypothetical protein